jgi:hypothetical protein
VETAVHDAKGIQVTGSGTATVGAVRGAVKAEVKNVRGEGRRVPYVPRYQGWATLDYTVGGIRFGTAIQGVAGREDETGDAFGDSLRIDLEAAYRFRPAAAPLGFRTLEASLRIENVTDVSDRRWPGLPAYGRGVVVGVRALVGERED